MRVTCRSRISLKAVIRTFAGLIAFAALGVGIYAFLIQPNATVGSIKPVFANASIGTLAPVTSGRVERQEPSAAPDAVILASPGRIEGKSDSVEVGAGIDGVIQTIRVREGQSVKRGQVLADIDCRDLHAALPVVRAELESLVQVRERLVRGSRKEERDGAAQRTAAAKAVAAKAATELERSRLLFKDDLIPRVTVEAAVRDAEVAEAEYQRALRNEELVNAEPLAEELARADADILAAQERIKVAQDRVGKCSVRAPMDGTVLRIVLQQGESFALVSPRPVLTMTDLSGRRVRAEVDERDVGKVSNCERVVVFSDAFPGRVFTGKVSRIASTMGRKSVLSGDPADKADRDILEVIAELEPAANALPVGLRVTVQFSR